MYYFVVCIFIINLIESRKTNVKLLVNKKLCLVKQLIRLKLILYKILRSKMSADSEWAASTWRAIFKLTTTGRDSI